MQTGGKGDLSMLGGSANENQQAFRQRFGLSVRSVQALGSGT
jgi:hypothetical protein